MSPFKSCPPTTPPQVRILPRRPIMRLPEDVRVANLVDKQVELSPISFKSSWEQSLIQS